MRNKVAGENFKDNMKSGDLTRRRGDIIFISAILLVCLTALCCLYLFKDTGDSVRVTVDKETYGVYPLSKDFSVDICGKTGSVNRLVIENGRAEIYSADCPDGICVSHPPVYRVGESIVCLPNKVVVTVLSKDEKDGLDTVIG